MHTIRKNQTVEDIGAIDQPILALSILPQTNRFSECMRHPSVLNVEKWTPQSYDAWVKTARLERKF